jgi:hypothetical protein
MAKPEAWPLCWWELVNIATLLRELADEKPLPRESAIFILVVIAVIVTSGFSGLGNTTTSTSATTTAQNPAECGFADLVNGTCGFAVKPPSWATAFPELNHTIYYTPDGMFGVVLENSTTYVVVGEPEVSGGVTIPAACVVTLPSGTMVVNQTSTYLIARLPNGVVANVTIPQYSFCPNSHR